LANVSARFIHFSKKTQRFLAQFGDRVALHYFLPHCPNDNRVECLCLHLQTKVTRNQRCKSMEDLMVRVFAFLRGYIRRAILKPSLKLATDVSGSRSVVWKFGDTRMGLSANMTASLM
jgi:hypothetical protein